FDGSIEMHSIIEARTEHDLAVELDTLAGQPGDLLHHTVIFRISQHDGAKLRLGCMNGDVQRRQPLFDDPLHLRFVDVRERQVISKKERETIVLILDVEGTTNILRILVYKAEDALILARQRLDRFELEPERLPLAPYKCDLPFLCRDGGPAPDRCC